MSKIRYLAVIIMIMIMLALAGCTKTWSVKFNQFTNLDAWAQQDWFPPSTINLYPDGLSLNGKILIGPYGFDGDFTFTCAFETSCGIGYTIPLIHLFFSDGGYAAPGQYLSINLNDVGDPSGESYSITATGAASLVVGGSIPFINRIGLNTIVLVKTGNHYEITLNGNPILDQFITTLGFDYFFPYLYAVTEDNLQIRFKSISYKYDGNRMSRP